MKARKNPTDEQLKRRLRRPPESDRDPRFKNDPYWVLRKQGHPHFYAKRAFRDQPPVFHERTVSIDAGDCDPEDLLFTPGSTWIEPEVAIRPLLTDQSIQTLEPRASEYTVWDSEVSRFGVRVRPSGHMSFVAYSCSTGGRRLRKHTIGTPSGMSISQARNIARGYRYSSVNRGCGDKV